MKRTYPRQIGFIIDEAMRQSGLDSRFDAQRAAAAWVDVVGPAINRYTTRRYVDGTVLHVYLSSAPLKQELSFQRPRIVEAINRAVGRGEVITDVIIH